MGWRENMGINQMVPESKTLSQYSQNPQIETIPGQIANNANIAIAKSDLENRLSELITIADNSKGMTAEQVEDISAEGSQIINQLPPETARGIFETTK